MIAVISYIALAFAGLRLLVAISNYLFFVSRTRKDIYDEPLVSVLIPARNEEKNIDRLLDMMLKQEYANLDIIVLDDGSEDNTSSIVRERMRKDKSIRLIFNDHVPEGWSGKNNACHKLAENAKGDFFLFIDADISISDNIISEMVQYMKLKNIVLLSIFPKQLMSSFGERITVPNMNWILLSLLPLIMVRLSKRPSLSAANGQFILFEKNVYNKMKPHEMLKSSLVEDIEMVRKIKKMKPDQSRRRSLKNRYRTAVITGDKRISCKMYDGFNDAVHGFSKNVLHFFGNSLIWTFIFLFLTGPVIAFIALFSLEYTLLFVLAGILIRLFISLSSKQNIAYNIFLAPLQQLSLYYIVYKAVKIKTSGEYTWKGRKIKTKEKVK